jgi:hypothetical protein
MNMQHAAYDNSSLQHVLRDMKMGRLTWGELVRKTSPRTCKCREPVFRQPLRRTKAQKGGRTCDVWEGEWGAGDAGKHPAQEREVGSQRP